MPDDPRITLIFDPFNICDSGETRVRSFVGGKAGISGNRAVALARRAFRYGAAEDVRD